MKVTIEFDLDPSGMDEDYIHDILDDWTHDIRVSRRLRSGTWRIDYDVTAL